jgi:hypothetical protein
VAAGEIGLPFEPRGNHRETWNWSVVSVGGSEIVACRTGNDGAVIGSSLGLNRGHCWMCILSKINGVIKGQSARGCTKG